MQNAYTQEKETGKEKVSDYASSVLRNEGERIKHVVSDVEKKIKQGEEQIKQLASTVDKQVHENPWPIVTGVAAGALLIGFIMGITRGK